MVPMEIRLNAIRPSTILQKQFIIIKNLEVCQSRSSHPEMFCEKDVLRNFAKFTGKHLCQSLFFDKVAGLNCRPSSINGIQIRSQNSVKFQNIDSKLDAKGKPQMWH